jgi:ABC-type phosphate transport system substrate-binding protein
MGVAHRVRRSALAAMCACGASAVLGLVAMPSSALAVTGETCKETTASGSSLQAEQQKIWTATVEGATFTLGKCVTVKNPKIKYTATSSGRGLTEFGAGTKILKPKESGNGEKLDGFIGTDDPPTALQLEEMEAATGTVKSKAETVPVVSAPIAMIIHLPEEKCTVTAGAKFKFTNKVLNELWLGKFAKWSELLTKVGLTFTECLQPITKMVRSDSSGTSFAFKQYLFTISEEEKTMPNPWAEFVTDASTWPAGTGAEKSHGGAENSGSGGEVAAVETTPGSVGYVNLANAASGKKFEAYALGKKKFWASVENGLAEGAEPNSGTKGNCPTALPKALPAEATANPPKWASVHLGSPKDEKYPLCTLTYDVGWENYEATNLITAYGSLAMAKEVGNTTTQYFEYMSFGAGQTNLAEFYSAMPAAVKKAAEEIIKTKAQMKLY